MPTNPFQTGDRFEIAANNESGHMSRVQSVNNMSVIATAPMKYGKTVMLALGGGYTVTRFTETGMIDFDAAVKNHFMEGYVHLMELDLLSEGRTVQRRSFFRFSALIPFRFTMTTDVKQIERDGVIQDIGGGGFRFAANDFVAEDDKLKCFLPIGGEYLILIAKILKTRIVVDPIFRYGYRCSFVDIPPKEQERIIRFIFAEQCKAKPSGDVLAPRRKIRRA